MEAILSVYCFDLVPVKSKWTRQHDAVMRSEYFPGLSPLMLLPSLRCAGRVPWCDPRMAERAIINRLSELGLRNRMTKS